jgi:2-polyprenyl-3-methyl-5-hydroxy-6-metoxy-1,4-benzoquinol methylase
VSVAEAETGGNVYDKYSTSNPIEKRLVSRFLDQLDLLVEETGAREAHEVGCGEGELAMRLARRGLRVRGSDAYSEVIAEARQRAGAAGIEVSYEVTPVEQLEPGRHAAELIVCCEVLEHLEDPASALDVLAGLARPWLVASVPREPLWRALNLVRLKYMGELGNTPGHLGHWSKRAFVGMLGRRFEVVSVHSPLPWTMALCRVR